MMTIVLGFIQFILIAYILIFEFRSKSSATFLWATLFLMFGVMHLLASIHGDDTFSNNVLNKASLFTICFCIIYYIVRFILGYKYMEIHRNYMSYQQLEHLANKENVNNIFWFIVFVAIVVLSTAPYIRYVGNIFSTSWSNGRDYSASLDYVNSRQIYRVMFYSLSGLMVSCYIKKEKWLFIGLSLLILGLSVITRNRIEILPFFCSVIAIFVIKNKKIDAKVIILGAIAAILVIYIVYGLRVFRHYGTIIDFIENFNASDFFARINRYIQTDNGELGLRKVFYYFLDNNNQFENFGKGHTYLRMLFVYIPTRWSLGLKPDDFAISMGRAYGMAAGGSTHPTLFGDCYANLDIFGVFLGAFWAIYATIADRIVISRKHSLSSILTYVLNAVVYIIIGRGSVYNGFWFIAYGVPLILIVEYLKYHVRIRFVRKKNSIW